MDAQILNNNSNFLGKIRQRRLKEILSTFPKSTSLEVEISQPKKASTSNNQTTNNVARNNQISLIRKNVCQLEEGEDHSSFCIVRCIGFVENDESVPWYFFHILHKILKLLM